MLAQLYDVHSPAVTYMVIQMEDVGTSAVRRRGLQTTEEAPDGGDMLRACIDRHGGITEPLEESAPMANGCFLLAWFRFAWEAVVCADALYAAPTGPESRIVTRVAIFSRQPGHGDQVKWAYWHGQHLTAMVQSGQTIVSHLAAQLAQPQLQNGYRLRCLGFHRLLDLQSVEPVYQLETARCTAEFPPLKSLDHVPNNLPLQLTTLVGREREMAEIKRLLASHRFITVTGAAGCGKSRLAYHVAASLAGFFDDGTWLVDLATVADTNLVPNALWSVLGGQEMLDALPLSGLVHDLRDKRMLIVLDTCEHLVGACAELVDTLIRACPQVRILATSREPLQSEGEVVWRVPSLEVPHLDGASTVEQVLGIEAVRLLADRAMESYSGFQVTSENIKFIAQICVRLDGIPLALEMAAARVGALSVEQIAARLDDRFRLLTGGRRKTRPRHETLRATLDWSYDLLSEKERLLWAHLSVFSGRFSLGAAEFVCQNEMIEEWEVLDLLSKSVNKSVLMVEHQHGQAYYWFLETVRQYGQEKLSLYGQEADVRHRHLEWYRRMASEAEAEIPGDQEVLWLERLAKEYDNFYAALVWCRTQPAECESGLHLAGCLGRLACVVTFMKQTMHAVRLSAAADLFRHHIGLKVGPSERDDGVEETRGRVKLGATASNRSAAAEAFGMLTVRQLEIIQLVAHGLSDKEVAAELRISPNTVDAHLRKIFAKLNVNSRVSLVRWAVRSGVDDGMGPVVTRVPVA